MSYKTPAAQMATNCLIGDTTVTPQRRKPLSALSSFSSVAQFAAVGESTVRKVLR